MCSQTLRATAQLINHHRLNAHPSRTAGIVDVDYATESGVYPIALVSYEVACYLPRVRREARQRFVAWKQWLTYVLSDEGQEVSEDYAGAAPYCLVRCASR